MKRMSLSIITQHCAGPKACFSKLALVRSYFASGRQAIREATKSQSNRWRRRREPIPSCRRFRGYTCPHEELRREREGVRASERDLQLDPLVRRGRIERWSAGETTAGPGRVRQSSSGTQPDRERASWARSESAACQLDSLPRPPL